MKYTNLENKRDNLKFDLACFGITTALFTVAAGIAAGYIISTPFLATRGIYRGIRSSIDEEYKLKLKLKQAEKRMDISLAVSPDIEPIFEITKFEKAKANLENYLRNENGTRINS